MTNEGKSNFEKLVVWQKSCNLAYRIILCNKKFSQPDQFNFGSQITRAAFSIASNIAEGSERHSKKEFLHFLSISLGSIAELKTQIYILMKSEIISKTDGNGFLKDLTEIHKMVNALRKSIKQKAES